MSGVLLLGACSDTTSPERSAAAGARPAVATAGDDGTTGIGGSVTMTGGGSALPEIPMRPTGLWVPAGVPVRVVVSGTITRTKTPELIDFCSIAVDLCNEFAFLLGDEPVLPSGVPVVDAAVAFASFDGGPPSAAPVGGGPILTTSTGGELWVGRSQFSCTFWLSTGEVGNCFEFGGSYTWTIHADDGSAPGDPASALLRLELAGQSGSDVALHVVSSDASSVNDVRWFFVPDAASVIDGAEAGAAAAGQRSFSRIAAANGTPAGPGLEIRGRRTLGSGSRASSTSPAVVQAESGVKSASADAPYRDVSACAGSIECETTMPAPQGTYVATALVHGVRRAAERRVSTTGGGGGGKPLTLACSPQTLTRGEEVDCAFEVTPTDATVQAIQWTFKGPGLERSNVDVRQWKGQMVLSGTISVSAQVNGSAATDQVDVTVTPRDWKSMVVPYRLAPEPKTMDAGNFKNFVAYPRDVHDLGAIIHEATVEDVGPHVNVVGFGPNTNVAYLRDLPVEVTAQVFLHPALAVGTAFWRAQRETAPVYADPRPCLRSDVLRFIPKALAHEGQGLEPDSHAGRFKAVLDVAGGADFEALWSKDELQPLQNAAKSAMDELFKKATAASAEADPNSPVTMGCVFDYTPSLGKN